MMSSKFVFFCSSSGRQFLYVNGAGWSVSVGCTDAACSLAQKQHIPQAFRTDYFGAAKVRWFEGTGSYRVLIGPASNEYKHTNACFLVGHSHYLPLGSRSTSQSDLTPVRQTLDGLGPITVFVVFAGVDRLGYFSHQGDQMAIDDRPARTSQQVDQEDARGGRH